MSNYEEAFELTGHGRFNNAVLASTTFILLHAMLESIGIAYVITGAECDLRLSVGEKGAVNAAAFVGIIITAIPWGTISDRYGRRSVMLPALFVAVVISFISALSTNFWALLILRFLVGCVVSASSATCLVYLGELTIKSHRDYAIALSITFVAFAFVIVPAVAWPIIPGEWSFSLGDIQVRPWRVFMWTWALPGLVGAVLLYFLPESPRYILAARGGQFAIPILANMYAINHATQPEDFPLATVESSTSILHKGTRNMWNDMTQMIKPPLLRCVLVSHYCLFIVFFLANGLYIWLPDLINEIMKDFGSSRSICQVIVDKYGKTGLEEDDECNGPVALIDSLMFPMSIMMETAFFVFFVLIALTIEKYNKLKIYFLVMVPMATCLALSSVVPHTGTAGILFTIGLACGGAASLLTALAVEIFPTSLRALSMCTMFMAGQLGAAAGSNILSLCLSGTCVFVFFIISIATIASALYLLKCWPDYDAVRRVMEERDFTY